VYLFGLVVGIYLLLPPFWSTNPPTSDTNLKLRIPSQLLDDSEVGRRDLQRLR